MGSEMCIRDSGNARSSAKVFLDVIFLAIFFASILENEKKNDTLIEWEVGFAQDHLDHGFQ